MPTAAFSNVPRNRSSLSRIASSVRFRSVMSRAGTRRIVARLPGTPGSSTSTAKTVPSLRRCRVRNATVSPVSSLRWISSRAAGATSGSKSNGMHSGQFVLRVPQALARLPVHVQDAAHVVVEEEGIRCVVHEHAEPSLAGPHASSARLRSVTSLATCTAPRNLPCSSISGVVVTTKSPPKRSSCTASVWSRRSLSVRVMRAKRRRGISTVDNPVARQANALLRGRAQPLGHRPISSYYLVVLVKDGDQVGYAVERPLPLALGPTNVLLGPFAL